MTKDPYYKTKLGKLYNGDALSVLKALPSESVSMCITSPPYWTLRDYGGDGNIWDADPDCDHEFGSSIPPAGYRSNENRNTIGLTSKAISNKDVWQTSNFCISCGAWKGQLGLEPDFNLYIKHLCDIFDEVKRVLRKDGTCWVNLGDTYSSGTKGGGGKESQMVKIKGQENFQAFEPRDFNCGGLPDKSLCNIPSRFSIEMQDRGWILRNKIIWHKPNCMPSSVKDRFTVDFEEIFFFVKNKKYYFEQQFEPYLTPKQKQKDEYRDRYNEESNNGYINNQPRLSQGMRSFYGKQGRNKRTVWSAETKYEDQIQEKMMRQGMNKERGNNLVEKRDLPPQKEFVDYIRKKYTVDQIVEKTGLKKTKVEHWFRHDEGGFSYPSKDDWEFLGDKNFPELINVRLETDEIKTGQNGRNKRTVWKISTKGYKGAHFAVFPKDLLETPIKAGCPKDGTVLDPFMGSGTVAEYCEENNLKWIGIEISKEYCELIIERVHPYASTSRLTDFIEDHHEK